jgi:hypothetical protein
LYGLGPLLRSVARTDPLSGEKINKLRKSYEGQIKNFELPGRNKAVRGERNVDEDQPGPLRRMAGSAAWGFQSDEQWNSEHAQSKIETTSDFRAKVKQAMQMQPGTVRNNTYWEGELGLSDKPKINALPQRDQISQPVLSRIPNGIPRSLPQATGEPKRQTRGKKRSYGDDSFVGYGEGYSDGDFSGDDGYSQRKRKKVT